MLSKRKEDTRKVQGKLEESARKVRGNRRGEALVNREAKKIDDSVRTSSRACLTLCTLPRLVRTTRNGTSTAAEKY